MAIVALLAAIIVPIFSTSSRRVNQQTCMNNLHALGVNLTQYWQDYGAYPAAPLPAYLRTLDPKYVPFGYLPTHATCSALNVAIPADELRAVSEFTGTDPTSFIAEVKITTLGLDGSPDEYEWTDNNWNTKHGPFAITEVETKLPLSRGVSIIFKSKYDHEVGDAWTVTLIPPLYDPDNDEGILSLARTWLQWQTPPPGEETITTALIPADSTVTPVSVNRTDFLQNDRAAVIRTEDGERELFIVKAVDLVSSTILTYQPINGIYPVGSIIEPGYFEFTMNPNDPDHPLDSDIYRRFISGNFGLARFLEVYGLNKRQYHCPQIEATADVETGANLRMSTEGAGYTRHVRFDTLLSGFNTYDATYNYDQYDNDIRYFDARLGFGELNAKRQLKEKYPPADTVVTWCYGHRKDQTPSFDHGSPDDPDVELATSIDNQQQSRRNSKTLVLWVDGTVASISPYLARGADDMFYWVPPFLYSRGEWQQ